MVVYNISYVANGNWGACDFAEIKNVSGEAVSLAGCSLSDKSDEARWSFPEDRVLQPGETLLVCCNDDEADGSVGNAMNTGFSLSAASEQLFLRGADGRLLDYAALHDIPIGGSLGRMDGEPGFFYFAERSPGHQNQGGCRRITDRPAAVQPDGPYNDVDFLTVELSSPGEIHYTTDGSEPSLRSSTYTEPITINATTVLRAVAVEEGALVSPVATYTYLINENHSLPVLSLVVNNLGDFNYIYNNGLKHKDLSANLALYDGEHSFNHASRAATAAIWRPTSLITASRNSPPLPSAPVRTTPSRFSATSSSSGCARRPATPA